MENNQKEKYEGVYLPTAQRVKFNREWGGHRFTDEECETLLSGGVVSFEAKSRGGKDYTANGRLMEDTYKGYTYWGFKLCDDVLPASFCGHKFTDEERSALENGLTVSINDAVSKKSGKQFACRLVWKDKDSGSGKEFGVLFD